MTNTMIVIGGGPAGEAAARYAAKKKVPVTLIERVHVGGLCLNRGCIPSKTLLSLGKKIADLKHSPILKDLAEERRSRLAREAWQEMKKEKEIGEDEMRKGQERVQKTTDDHISKVDGIVNEKEKEIMEI